jgi:uncharacterized protein involved in exopolysaccharide biosynthesis
VSESRRRGDSLLHPVSTPSPADQIIGSIARHWPIIVSLAVAAAVLATLVSMTQPKRYRAEAVGAVGLTPAVLSTSETLHGVDTLDRRVVVASLAALASTPAVAQQAHAASDDVIDAIVLPSTSLFRVTVQGRDAAHVAAVANAIPAALNAQARSIYAVYSVMMVSPATRPTKPSAPRTERAAFAGLLVGALAGVVVAYLLDRRRPQPVQ